MFTVTVDNITELEWNNLLDGFADANIYQTWAYGAVSWGERQLSHLVVRHLDRPVAAAQVRVIALPLLRAGVAYIRWGPLCVLRNSSWDDEVFDAVSHAIVEEYVKRRRLLLRILPQQFVQDTGGDVAQQGWQRLGLRPACAMSPYRTLRLDLDPPLAALRKQLDQKWRNQLNAAERNGLTIEEGYSDDLFSQFLKIYDEMMARKQFDSAVDPLQFSRIQRRLADRQKMLLLMCRKDGQPLGGLVCSVGGDTAIYLLGATSDEGMRWKGSYILQWAAIQRIKALGCRWYDLGGINPEKNPGVYHFKKGLGGKEVNGLDRFELSGGLPSSISMRSAEWIRRLGSAKRQPA